MYVIVPLMMPSPASSVLQDEIADIVTSAAPNTLHVNRLVVTVILRTSVGVRLIRNWCVSRNIVSIFEEVRSSKFEVRNLKIDGCHSISESRISNSRFEPRVSNL